MFLFFFFFFMCEGGGGGGWMGESLKQGEELKECRQFEIEMCYLLLLVVISI